MTYSPSIQPNTIDPTKPTEIQATTASVRNNFQAIKTQFENTIADISSLDLEISAIYSSIDGRLTAIESNSGGVVTGTTTYSPSSNVVPLIIDVSPSNTNRLFEIKKNGSTVSYVGNDGVYYGGVDLSLENLQDLADVGSAAPANNQVLKYSSSTGSWNPGVVASTELSDSSNLVRNNVSTDISAHWEWQDGLQARFGNDADLAISHNGTNGFIASSSGTLYIEQYASGAQVILRGEDTSGTMRAMILCDPDNTVIMYHNGSERFRTESAGVTVTGTLHATVDVTTASDLKIKANLKEIEEPNSKLSQISGYRYDRTDVEEKDMFGLVAQEVEKILPSAVKESNGIKSVNYNAVTALLVNAVKELSAENATLKTELAEIKEMIKGMQK